MAQHTVDLVCTADTYIDQNNTSTNYGSATTLLAGEDSAGGYYIRQSIYFRFDTSSLIRKKIISVYLKAYVIDIETLYGGYVYVDLVNVNFDENTATYENTPLLTYSGVLRNTNTITAGQYQEFSALGVNKFLYPTCVVSARRVNDGYARIKLTSREGTNKPLLKVTYEDVPPSEPTLTTPISVYKDSASVIRFEWQYNSSVGGEQKKFDLQWSTNQLDWTTISETTANNYYDMPADTFPAGNIYWRVRCYNEYDESSGYSDIQSFFAIGAPTIPAINAVPTDTARPTIIWSAFSQQVYQLQVLSGAAIVYDSGIVPGINIRSHKITAWLADGEYTVQMRIKNEYDMWSDWGSSAVTISTVKPDKPALSLQRSAYGVEINSTGLVYRSDYDKDDYICIGAASGNFYDNTVKSNAEYKYFVRAVSENDTFADSDVKFIQADFRHSLIAPVLSLNNVFVFMHGLNTPPNRTYNRQPGGASVMYAGRKHPVWEPTEHISTGLSLQFYLEIWAEVEAFTAIYDQNSTVLYRDAKGRKIYGTLSNLSVADDILGYIISFTLNQVDYIEELEV